MNPDAEPRVVSPSGNASLATVSAKLSPDAVVIVIGQPSISAGAPGRYLVVILSLYRSLWFASVITAASPLSPSWYSRSFHKSARYGLAMLSVASLVTPGANVSVGM